MASEIVCFSDVCNKRSVPHFIVSKLQYNAEKSVRSNQNFHRHDFYTKKGQTAVEESDLDAC